LQNDVHITSFAIRGIDAPLHGRQCKVPYAGNCCLVRRDIKRGVTCIIAVVELILQNISPVWQIFDGPLQNLVNVVGDFRFSIQTFSPTFVLVEIPATTPPSFGFKSIAQFRYLTFSIV
jgi:hypothetical protein